MRYSKFTETKKSPGLLFWQVATLWQRKIKEGLRLYDLTHTQFVILAVTQELNDRKLIASQKEISNFSMIDVMTLSTTLRLLEKKELIVRKNHPTDTRAKQISNTNKGKLLLKQVNKIIEEIDAQFFFPESEDLNSFLALLEKLKEQTKD